jgi:hypothetical protein
VQSLGGCGKACSLHVCKLMGEDCPDGVLVIHVVGKVHVDGVSVDVGVLSRVDSCKVLVIDKDRTV